MWFEKNSGKNIIPEQYRIHFYKEKNVSKTNNSEIKCK